MHRPVETERHVLHTQARGPCVWIKIYREKGLVAGAGFGTRGPWVSRSAICRLTPKHLRVVDFGGAMEDERTFGGSMIPSRVGWYVGSQQFEVGRRVLQGDD